MSRFRDGLFWVAVARYTSRAVGVLTTLVLASLLSPREFGLMVGAMIVIDLLTMLCDFGISKELVCRIDRLEEAAHTANGMIVATGSCLFLVAIVLSPFMDDIFGLEGLTEIMLCASTVLLISSFARVPAALMQKEMRFKALAIPLVGASLVASVTSIVAALLGAGAYSLVIREVAGSVTVVALTFIVSGYRPRLRFNPALAREIFAFAKHLLGANLLATLIKQTAPVILARLYGGGILGAYGFADRLATLPVREPSTILNRVLFPSFSERRQDPAAMGELLCKSTKLAALVSFPTAVIIAWFCKPLLQALFDHKWDHAILFFQVLPFYAVVLGLVGASGEACKACGRTQLMLGYYVLHFLILAICILPAITLFGPVGVVVAGVVGATVAFFWLTYKTTVLLGLPYKEFCKSLTGISTAALATILGLLAVRTVHVFEPASQLAIEGLSCLALFGGVLLILERAFLASLRTSVTTSVRRGQGHAASQGQSR